MVETLKYSRALPRNGGTGGNAKHELIHALEIDYNRKLIILFDRASIYYVCTRIKDIQEIIPCSICTPIYKYKYFYFTKVYFMYSLSWLELASLKRSPYFSVLFRF